MFGCLHRFSSWFVMHDSQRAKFFPVPCTEWSVQIPWVCHFTLLLNYSAVLHEHNSWPHNYRTSSLPQLFFFRFFHCHWTIIMSVEDAKESAGLSGGELQLSPYFWTAERLRCLSSVIDDGKSSVESKEKSGSDVQCPDDSKSDRANVEVGMHASVLLGPN